MPRNARCFEILIASPGDVQAERQIIIECIEDWNSAHSASIDIVLVPRRWELDTIAEIGGRAQDSINRQIVDSSDILLGVFWSRLGTPTGISESGTVEEIERIVAAGKPASLYFSQAPVPFKHDVAQLAALVAYKRQIAPTALYFEFCNLDDFRRLITRNLAARMNQLVSGMVNDRTAQLERAVLQLQQKIREREVTSEQAARLRTIARDNPKGIVTIQKLDQDPEAVKYAQQLFDALLEAGWTPQFSPGRVIGGMQIGLRLSIYSQQVFEIPAGNGNTHSIPLSSPVFYGQALKNSLEAVGISVDHFEVRSGPPIPRNSVNLSIGHRP